MSKKELRTEMTALLRAFVDDVLCGKAYYEVVCEKFFRRTAQGVFFVVAPFDIALCRLREASTISPKRFVRWLSSWTSTCMFLDERIIMEMAADLRVSIRSTQNKDQKTLMFQFIHADDARASPYVQIFDLDNNTHSRRIALWHSNAPFMCVNGCTEYAALTCSGCKARRYCSVECQRKNWLEHKANCLQFRYAAKTCGQIEKNDETNVLGSGIGGN